MLKLGYTLPNFANNCLHKSTSAKFYSFSDTDKDLLQKIREDMVGGPSIVFTRKAVVDETFIRDSGNICKSIVGIGASQLYPYSMCQPMPTGLYTRWEYDTESNRFKPQQNKSRNLENMVMSYFQRRRRDCKFESFYTTGTQKKIDCFKVDGFCAHFKTVFEAMGCFYLYFPCQEARPSLTEEDIERGNRFYGYQISDRSRHTVTKTFNDEKTHGTINTKLFKRLDHINDQLYEVELAKAEIEHRNQSLLGFSYSNTLNLECWSFTTTFLRDSVTSTTLSSSKSTLILCIWLCLKKSCMIAFEKNLKLNGAY